MYHPVTTGAIPIIQPPYSAQLGSEHGKRLTTVIVTMQDGSVLAFDGQQDQVGIWVLIYQEV